MDQTLISALISGGIGGIVGPILIGVLAWCFRSYLSGYLVKKAENLATKQDVQILTRLQEEVKAEFNKLLERQRSEAQLRLAVVERRFQAHQEAHTLWIRLSQKVHSDEIGKVVIECQRWWEENSLYLDPNARQAFRVAYHAAFDHRDLREGPRDEDHRKIIEDNWRTIREAGPTIEAAVNLPRLDVSEIQRPGEAEPTALPADKPHGE